MEDDCSDGYRARAAMLGIFFGRGTSAHVFRCLSDVKALAFRWLSRPCAYRDREVVKIVS